jgi:hypothetical protein
MRPGQSQTRVLAILFISAAVGYAYWRGDLRRDVARQVGHDIGRELDRDFGRDIGADLGRDLGRDVARLKLPTNVVRLAATPPTAPRPSATVIAPAASPLVDTVAGYGILLPSGSDSVASFYFATLVDSSTSLADLGFISATRLLDSGSRFEPFGDERGLPHVRVASRAQVDSALRVRDDECVVDVPVPVRPALPANGSWIIALAPGAAETVPSSVWRIDADSVDRTGEALRLARSLTMDTSHSVGTERVAAALAAAPLQLVTHHHFVADGAEIMIVETRRSSRQPTDTASGPTLDEHRLLIAERAALDKTAPFRVVWHQFSIDDPDQLVTETPLAMLRLGEARTLTLFTDGHYRDGGGGLFIARLGRGKWRTVASWYTGC